MINIELSQEDALMFVEFQKRYSMVKLLEEFKVFDIRNGSVEIHFNNFGGIGLVKVINNYRPI